MEKLLVTQALNELKLLDNRIINEIARSKFVTSAKTVESKITPYLTKEEFVKKAKGGFDSVNALMERRAKIKAAVLESNSVTKVEINGVTMTVAEALELKNSIVYKEELLEQLKLQYSSATTDMTRKNVELEKKIDNILETMVSKDAKTKKEDFTEITDPMRQNGEYSLVDPLRVQDIIEKLRDEISGFKSNVDAVLQISNCITYIEF